MPPDAGVERGQVRSAQQCSSIRPVVPNVLGSGGDDLPTVPRRRAPGKVKTLPNISIWNVVPLVAER
ncbi:MAG TPA: hypothetical protein VLJ88_00255 [Propionibacteriaceae bacterium]|nr:hypothetical protein [Propionibacteriaceae bacterium]